MIRVSRGSVSGVLFRVAPQHRKAVINGYSGGPLLDLVQASWWQGVTRDLGARRVGQVWLVRANVTNDGFCTAHMLQGRKQMALKQP